jgi:hypothetical protein
MRTASTAVILLLGLLTSACGSGNTAAPTPPSGPTTDVFFGTLAVQGSSFYSFTVTASGPVSITLASLVPTEPGPAIHAVMGLGVGTPVGTDCGLTNSVNAAPSLTAQLINSLSPGTYCTQISDLGALTAPVNFSVRIVHN